MPIFVAFGWCEQNFISKILQVGGGVWGGGDSYRGGGRMIKTIQNFEEGSYVCLWSNSKTPEFLPNSCHVNPVIMLRNRLEDAADKTERLFLETKNYFTYCLSVLLRDSQLFSEFVRKISITFCPVWWR